MNWANVLENFIADFAAGALVVIIFSFLFPWWLKRSKIQKQIQSLLATIAALQQQVVGSKEEQDKNDQRYE